MIVSFNFYYGHPGKSDEVLAQRLRASDVRVRIGIPYGLVMRRASGSGELPDVIWALDYDAVDGHERDMAARAASPEFEAIRAGMRALIRRFERPLFEVCGVGGAPRRTLRGAMVGLDWIFCAPEKTGEVVAMLEAHVGANGRLLRLITPGTNLPQVIWQHDGGGGFRLAQPTLRETVDVQASTWEIVQP